MKTTTAAPSPEPRNEEITIAEFGWKELKALAATKSASGRRTLIRQAFTGLRVDQMSRLSHRDVGPGHLSVPVETPKAGQNEQT